jgi:hypothetical protein
MRARASQIQFPVFYNLRNMSPRRLFFGRAHASALVFHMRIAVEKHLINPPAMGILALELVNLPALGQGRATDADFYRRE